MIDLTKLDPYLLYELERQMRAAFGDDKYVTISLDYPAKVFVLGVYDEASEWRRVCYGNENTLVGAARKCGEDLAAAEENKGTSNDA